MTSILITPEMELAGLRAFRDELGYHHNGDASDAVKAIFAAMYATLITPPAALVAADAKQAPQQ
jgi:ferric iron reductase protein FhuF